MKSKLLFSVVSIVILLNLCLVSVQADGDFDIQCTKQIEVNGGVYSNGDISKPVDGASVVVECIHNGTTTKMATDTTDSDGDYEVKFSQKKGGNTVCTKGDTLKVTAEKDGITGENSKIIDSLKNKLNIFHIDVPLVPEFGLLIGGLTLISAIGVFFLVRRK